MTQKETPASGSAPDGDGIVEQAGSNSKSKHSPNAGRGPAGNRHERRQQLNVAAKSYHKKKWVPLCLNGKKPLGKAWQKRTLADPIPQFHECSNIGILLGEPSGGLVRLDYDFPRVPGVYEELFSPSLTFGRASSPSGGRLFACEGLKTTNFNLPDSIKGDKRLPLHDGKPNLTVFQILSTGAQTMAPPSIHPDTKQVVRWETPLNGLTEIAPTELLRLVGIEATLMVACHFWPARPNRNFAAMALARVLLEALEAAEPDEDRRIDLVDRLVTLVAMAGGDGEASRKGKQRAAKTLEKMKAGEETMGLKRLVELMVLPEDVIKLLRMWLGIGASDELVLAANDPMPSARALVAEKFTKTEGQALYRHRGAFWQWTGSYYHLADDETIKAQIWGYLEKAKRREKEKVVPFKPIRENVGNVFDALGAVTQLDKYIEPPAWLKDGDTLPLPSEFMAFANGLLHLPSGKLYPPTPQYFGVVASDVAFDALAAPPVQWLAFLDQLFGRDRQAKILLQDCFGYYLAPDTSLQKILLVVGPKRSGKGTIARIIRALVGAASVGGPTMASLGEQFGLEPLITKTLAIVSDARIGKHTDKSQIVERLLSISGEDALSVPRKFKQAWDGQLKARFMILTNELPSLTDGSGALAGRFVVLLLTNSFFGKEDPKLTGKLLTELPGILNWAIEGYRRLRKRGHFVMPKSAVEAVEHIEMLGAPVKAFIAAHCNVGAGLMVPVDDLWKAYQIHSEDEGRKDPGNKEWFGRNLLAAVPGVKNSKKGPRGERVPTYIGIELSQEGKETKDDPYRSFWFKNR